LLMYNDMCVRLSFYLSTFASISK